MMKILCFIVASLACINLIGAQRCDTGEDCKEGKCCVTKIPGVFWFPMGSCKRLLKEGEECMPDFLHNMAGDGKYFVKCPCKEGLECEKEHRYSKKQKCINPDPPTTAEPEITKEQSQSQKLETTTAEEDREETTFVTDATLDRSTANDTNSTSV